MFYKFPTIKTIDDVLPAIKDKPEFIVAEKNDYCVVNYVVNKPDTFHMWWERDPSYTDEMWANRLEENNWAAIWRECRGMIFDHNGDILSRPLHKFFNCGEREEVLPNKINLSEDYEILDKLDGSMVRPIYFKKHDGFRLGTKMGITDTSLGAERFLGANPHYYKFFRVALGNGQTPIFEFVSPRHRIVIDYKKPNMTLIAMRDTVTGEYMNYHGMRTFASFYDIPCVETIGKTGNIADFIEEVKGQRGLEGYVMRFHNGHMLKFKAEEYVLLHKSKETASNPRHIVAAILNNSIDDLKTALQPDDLKRVMDIEKALWEGVAHWEQKINTSFKQIRATYGDDRKAFALSEYTQKDPFMKGAAFKMWDGKNAQAYLLDFIDKNTGQDRKFELIIDYLGFDKKLFCDTN